MSLWPVCLAAQTTGAPQGGLFGGRSDANARQSLTFMVSLNEAYDSELPPEFRSRVPQQGLQSGGFSTMLTATMDYARNRRRTQISGTALTSLRYYQELDRVSATSHSAALGATVNLSRLASLKLNQTGAYSPSYLYQLFPSTTVPEIGDAIPAAPDYRVDETESYTYASRAELSFGSPRGQRFTTSAEYSGTDFQQTERNTRPDLKVWTGRASYSRGIGRSHQFSTQYEYRTGEFGFGGQTEEHRVRVGGTYVLPVSARRRITLRGNLAPSTVLIPETALSTQVTGRLYRADGDASLDFQVTRAWAARASYRRSLEYIAALAEPVFSDGATIGITGLIGRRFDVSSTAAYAVGESALNRGSGNLDTYTADARLRFAVSRTFAIYGEYLYYYYDLRGQPNLDPALPALFKQHSGRIGFNWFVTALGR